MKTPRPSVCLLLPLAASFALSLFAGGCAPLGDGGQCKGAAALQIQEAPLVPAGYTTFGAEDVRYLSSNDITPMVPAEKYLCTDDEADANRWFVTAHPYASAVVTTVATDKYFEITSKDGAVSRVDRCTFVDRTAFDASLPYDSAVVGTLHVRPIAASDATDDAEYFFAQLYVNHSLKVLAVSSSETEKAFVTDFTVGADVSVDTPELVTYHDTLSIDKATGTMTMDYGHSDANLCQ